jgi:hypothetical protein
MLAQGQSWNLPLGLGPTPSLPNWAPWLPVNQGIIVTSWHDFCKIVDDAVAYHSKQEHVSHVWQLLLAVKKPVVPCRRNSNSVRRKWFTLTLYVGPDGYIINSEIIDASGQTSFFSLNCWHPIQTVLLKTSTTVPSTQCLHACKQPMPFPGTHTASQTKGMSLPSTTSTVDREALPNANHMIWAVYGDIKELRRHNIMQQQVQKTKPSKSSLLNIWISRIMKRPLWLQWRNVGHKKSPQHWRWSCSHWMSSQPTSVCATMFSHLHNAHQGILPIPSKSRPCYLLAQSIKFHKTQYLAPNSHLPSWQPT